MLTVTLLASGCGNVPIQNTEVCWDAGNLGAYCINTLIEDARDIPKPEWDTLRFGMGCMSDTDFGEIKASIEKLCAKPGACSYEFKKKYAEYLKKEAKVKKKLYPTESLPTPHSDSYETP